MAYLKYRVAGTTFYPDGQAVLAAWTERYQRRTTEDPDIPVRLQAEPDNPYDPEAVSVWIMPPGGGEWTKAGHLPAGKKRPPEGASIRVAVLWIHPDHPDRPGLEIRASWAADPKPKEDKVDIPEASARHKQGTGCGLLPAGIAAAIGLTFLIRRATR